MLWGCNVVFEQSYGAPRIMIEDVTVAKAIEFNDTVKNVGLSPVK